jgi:hypothetical protein
MGEGQTALWLAVIASGLYHGLSPGMGWPLAVSAALFEKRAGALLNALLLLAAGHFAAMSLVLLPFVFLDWLVAWSSAVRIGAGLAVFAFGLWRLVDRRHPRALARVKPTQLAFWSFLVAIAHGAGLLLVPIYLGMQMHAGMGHAMPDELGAAFIVAAIHTLAMLAGSGVAAWAVYRYLGLQFLKKGWFDLEALWAASLMLAGAIGMWTAMGE